MSKYGYLREALVARRLLPPAGGFVSPAPASVARVAAVHALRLCRAGGEPDPHPGRGPRHRPAQHRRRRPPRLPRGGRHAPRRPPRARARRRLQHGRRLAPRRPRGRRRLLRLQRRGRRRPGAPRRGRRSPASSSSTATCTRATAPRRIFAGRADVLTLSLHAERNYPARKARSHLDFPLPDRLGDRAYLEVLAHALGSSSPSGREIVFYNAGVDPHAGDRLGRLALSDAGLRARDAPGGRLGAPARAFPLVGVLGGGYDNEPERLAARHAILFEEAARAADGENHGQG